jgi:PAS domain S-box-containing protein
VDDTFFIVRELQRGGFQVDFERVETHAAMTAALETQQWDLIISDYALPLFGGDAALALYRDSGMDAPFIFVSGALGEDRAVDLIKAGAHDVIMKNHLARLVPAVKAELQTAQERRIRKRTETVTAYLASIVRSCDDAIVGETLDGTIISWNGGAERLFGYSASEMVGRSIEPLLPSYRPDQFLQALQAVHDGQGVQRLETVRIRKDGTPVEVSLTVSPIKDEAGRVIGVSTVARDITSRKREEHERLELIQELTVALSHARF